jgi:hypothetical protein
MYPPSSELKGKLSKMSAERRQEAPGFSFDLISNLEDRGDMFLENCVQF